MFSFIDKIMHTRKSLVTSLQKLYYCLYNSFLFATIIIFIIYLLFSKYMYFEL